MKKKDPAIKLLIRSVVILTAVVLLCRVTGSDRHAIAGDLGDVLTSDVSIDVVARVISEYSADRRTGSESSDAGKAADRTAAEGESPDVGQKADKTADDGGQREAAVSDTNGSSAGQLADGDVIAESAGTEGEAGGEVIDIPSDNSSQTPASDAVTEVKTSETDVPEEPAGESGAGEDVQVWYNDSGINYNEFGRYRDMTDDATDDGETWNAGTVPTGVPGERFTYLTDSSPMTCTVGSMPMGYRSASEARKHMVTVSVPVRMMGDNGEVYPSVMDIMVNERLADQVKAIFNDIYVEEEDFAVKEIKGYAYRRIAGAGRKQFDYMAACSLGAAIDLNYGCECNGLYIGAGNDLRATGDPCCITDGVIAIFERYGWYWGGDYNSCCETYHFQYLALEDLSYALDERGEVADEAAFPSLWWGKMDMDPEVVRNLQGRLVELGYLDRIYTAFNEQVNEAVTAFQRDNGLEAFGTVRYDTWECLINKTHTYPSVF